MLELQAPGEIWAPTQQPSDKPTVKAEPITPPGKSTSISPLLAEAQNTPFPSHLRHRHTNSRQSLDIRDEEPLLSGQKRTDTPTIPEDQNEDLSTAAFPQPQKPPRRYSMRFISLQVILAPLQNMWLYIISLMTLSQERYHHVVRQRKKSRHVRLEEPVLRFAEVAFCVEDKPVVLWAWRMVGMFIWPIARMLGGGVFTDK